MGALKLAVQLLTVLPTPPRVPGPSGPPGRATAWFPLVGAAVGAPAVLLLHLPVPRIVAAAGAVLALAAVTGALHEDGLMDAADALFVPGDRERRREVLADPRVGGFGVTAVVTVLLLRFALLAEIRPVGALVAPLLGRWAMAVSLARAPALRAEGLGASFRRGARPGAATLVVAALLGGVAVARALARGGPPGPDAGLPGGLPMAEAARLLGAWALAAAVAGAFGALAVRRLGGMNGDAHGAGGYLAETAALLAFLPGP